MSFLLKLDIYAVENEERFLLVCRPYADVRVLYFKPCWRSRAVVMCESLFKCVVLATRKYVVLFLSKFINSKCEFTST